MRTPSLTVFTLLFQHINHYPNVKVLVKDLDLTNVLPFQSSIVKEHQFCIRNGNAVISCFEVWFRSVNSSHAVNMNVLICPFYLRIRASCEACNSSVSIFRINTNISATTSMQKLLSSVFGNTTVEVTF